MKKFIHNVNAVDPHNRQITCTVNGHSDIDLSQISCPICKGIMEICAIQDEQDEYRGHLDFESSPICFGALDRVYNASGIRVTAIDLRCPNCEAVLKVKHTTNIRERQICH